MVFTQQESAQARRSKFADSDGKWSFATSDVLLSQPATHYRHEHSPIPTIHRRLTFLHQWQCMCEHFNSERTDMNTQPAVMA